MASSRCLLALERNWTEEKERALIAFFSKHSCLWDHRSEDYKNRQLRWKTLEHLRILLSSVPPPVPFRVEDIKNKFKNLRTTFQRQNKLVRASREAGSDGVFAPQWKHYQQLMFLRGCWDQDDGPDDPPPSPLNVPPEDNRSVLASPGLIVSFLPSSSSSCVPFVVKSYWTEERERALISFYKDHSCLWSKTSENYNNRQLRQKLLDSLRTLLSDHLVSFTVDDVKCKFKNLRTVFNREHKSVQVSRTSDKPYTSKWKHYHQLLFLCEDDCPDDLQVLSVHEGRDVERGSPPPSSGSSQTGSNPSTASTQTEGPAEYQIPVAPDHLKLSPPTLPASPSRSPDRKPCLVPLDGRLSTESRCLWSEVKVQQLISFYSEHSCLWNHRLENYRNRFLRQSLLEKLSGLLSQNEPVPFSVEDIKTKFRNLRTIFQREHKAVSSNRTCGSEDFYLPKWKHYPELMFLCNSCDEDDEEFLHQRCSTSNQTASSQTVMVPSLNTPPSPTPPDSQRSSPSSSPSTPSSHTDRRAPGCKRARRQPPASTGELMELMRSVCQNQSASPHAGFLKYVEECLNETPPDKVKKLKKKIIETIHNATEEV
ncbi:uncharacterized protein LOC119424588 [Nematolebias whitei]|uniref:uncharacterized protein LOC119424588 n=1 Tax=Nematolebias whitei TaxID=451745 RepID=UPI00189B9822|nr:uncharacterized protein LOC119424588 [Nematolebias whitei]